MKNLPDFFRDASANLYDQPLSDLFSLQRQMNQAFNRLWNEDSPAFAPNCDIEDAESHYLMSFDLPGVKKEDIKIDFKDGVLTVTAERKNETEKKDKTKYRSERFYGLFSRSIQLPQGVKPEQVESHYADGVLRVAVPKTETKAQQIKIGESKPGFWEKLLGRQKDETKVAQTVNSDSKKFAPEKSA